MGQLDKLQAKLSVYNNRLSTELYDLANNDEVSPQNTAQILALRNQLTGFEIALTEVSRMLSRTKTGRA